MALYLFRNLQNMHFIVTDIASDSFLGQIYHDNITEDHLLSTNNKTFFNYDIESQEDFFDNNSMQNI